MRRDSDGSRRETDCVVSVGDMLRAMLEGQTKAISFNVDKTCIFTVNNLLGVGVLLTSEVHYRLAPYL